MERRPTRQNFYLWSDPRTATATSGNYLDRDTDLPPSKKLGKISRGGPPTVHLASKTRKNPRNNLSVRINEFGTICFFHKREKKRSKYILHSTDTSAVLSRMNAKRFTILFPQPVMYRQSIFRSLEIETTTLETGVRVAKRYRGREMSKCNRGKCMCIPLPRFDSISSLKPFIGINVFV